MGTAQHGMMPTRHAVNLKQPPKYAVQGGEGIKRAKPVAKNVFEVKKKYLPNNPPCSIPFDFLAEKKLRPEVEKDKEHLMASLHALPHFVPDYKGRMPKTGEDTTLALRD